MTTPAPTKKRGRRRGFTSRNVLIAEMAMEIAEREHPLTLRALFYQLASAGGLPNSQPHYKRLMNVVARLREDGMMPCGWLTDNVRQTMKPSSWSGLPDFWDSVRRSYRKSFWASQPEYIEIALEKDALASTTWPVTHEFDVSLRVIRGFSSITYAMQIAQEWRHIQKPITMYYVGDYDPSGMAIEADLRAKLSRYSGRTFQWQRLAVVEHDFDAFDLLPLPVKTTDVRSRAFHERYGSRCAEADALPPSELRRRVRTAIESHIDRAAWDRLRAVEAAEKQSLDDFHARLAAKVDRDPVLPEADA